MDCNRALSLAQIACDSFRESGSIFEEFLKDEHVSQAEYEDMINMLCEMQTE